MAPRRRPVGGRGRGQGRVTQRAPGLQSQTVGRARGLWRSTDVPPRSVAPSRACRTPTRRSPAATTSSTSSAPAGMGAVWRAWDLREQRFVAVKVLRPHADRAAPATCCASCRSSRCASPHPHVAAPTGWVADDERVAFAMELARGGTLADLVADRRGEPLGSSYVAELLGQLLDGLAAVHAAGVVHRDVKPANLLLEATGRGRPHLRIGDFGVAALLGRPVEPAGTSVGTTGYAAPEQLAGAAPDPRQDLYAAGVTARRLLGRAPGPLDALVADLTRTDPDRRRRRRSRPGAGSPSCARPDRCGARGCPTGSPRSAYRCRRRDAAARPARAAAARPGWWPAASWPRVRPARRRAADRWPARSPSTSGTCQGPPKTTGFSAATSPSWPSDSCAVTPGTSASRVSGAEMQVAASSPSQAPDSVSSRVPSAR